jgi:hypothetical protein
MEKQTMLPTLRLLWKRRPTGFSDPEELSLLQCPEDREVQNPTGMKAKSDWEGTFYSCKIGP